LIPKDKADVEFAARLVLDGFLEHAAVHKLMALQDELIRQQKPLTIAQIAVKKQIVTRSEARFLLSPDAPPANLVDGYTIKGLLGIGGMSRVFEATSEAFGDRPLALKILKPHLARRPVQKERFIAEAQFLMELDSPSIVRGEELIEHDGLVAFAMELVPGKSLLEHMESGHKFSEDAALYIVLQTAKALSHLWRRGLVHRDIKPANILVTSQNTVKLCDLGLATRTGGAAGDDTTVGTVAYIAPEQAMADAGVDVRADIYALGVTLYHCVVGEIPFQGSDDQETMAKRFVESLSSPKLAHVSPHMHYFIQKMMASDKELRYQSPKELISDIEESIRGKKTLTIDPALASSKDLEIERPFDAAAEKKTPARKPETASRSKPKPKPFWRDR
jgi:eukaryotic-like serine/threonine-protein kinase